MVKKLKFGQILEILLNILVRKRNPSRKLKFRNKIKKKDKQKKKHNNKKRKRTRRKKLHEK